MARSRISTGWGNHRVGEASVRGSESPLLPFLPNSAGSGSLCLTQRHNIPMTEWSVAVCLCEKQTLFVLLRLLLPCFTSYLGKKNIVWQTPSWKVAKLWSNSAKQLPTHHVFSFSLWFSPQYVGAPVAYIQQIFVKATVSPWQKNFLAVDVFRSPLSRVFQLVEEIRNHALRDR